MADNKKRLKEQLKAVAKAEQETKRAASKREKAAKKDASKMSKQAKSAAGIVASGTAFGEEAEAAGLVTMVPMPQPGRAPHRYSGASSVYHPEQHSPCSNPGILMSASAQPRSFMCRRTHAPLVNFAEPNPFPS